MLLAALLALMTPQQQCAAMDANLPAALAVWTKARSHDGQDLTLGVATVFKTELRGDEELLVPDSAKQGMMIYTSFTVTTEGTYGIAIDQPGWIDVVVGTVGATTVPPASHGHGPDCSTIRKIVRFDLKPGTYRLFVSGMNAPEVRVLIVRP